MVLMIATRELRYAAKQLKVGDIFEASVNDAKILKSIKKADNAPEVKEPPRRSAPAPAAVPRKMSLPDAPEITQTSPAIASPAVTPVSTTVPTTPVKPTLPPTPAPAPVSTTTEPAPKSSVAPPEQSAQPASTSETTATRYKRRDLQSEE